jgi:hypothetical protein
VPDVRARMACHAPGDQIPDGLILTQPKSVATPVRTNLIKVGSSRPPARNRSQSTNPNPLRPTRQPRERSRLKLHALVNAL